MRALGPVVLVVVSLIAPELAGAVPGDPDRSFGRAGVASIPVPDEANRPLFIAEQPSGRILVGASYSSGIDSLYGLTPNGRLDRRYGRQGHLGGDSPPGTPTMLPGGGLLLGRLLDRFGPTSWLRLARYTRNGKRDRRFGAGGAVRIPVPDKAWSVASALAPDGDLIVVLDNFDGHLRGPVTLLRISPTGKLDPSFGNGGRARLPSYDDLSEPQVAVQRSGRIVILAKAESRAGLGGTGIELFGVQPDGGIDRAFGGNGDGTIARPELSGSLALAPNDEIVLLTTRLVDGLPAASVTRLPADGVGLGTEATLPPGTRAEGQALALDARGAAIVSATEKVPPMLLVVRALVARLGSDGFDSSFRTGAAARRNLWFSEGAGPMAVLHDGDILISPALGHDGSRGRAALTLMRLQGGYPTDRRGGRVRR